jgi:hypothetical protein
MTRLTYPTILLALSLLTSAATAYAKEAWVAKAKDAVENALHQEVCAGTLTLSEARPSSRQIGSSITGRRF